MSIRREAAVVETVERMKRQEENHPNKKIVKNYRHTERIKKKSVLSLSNRLAEKYNMPDERETVLLFDVNNSPAKNIQTPIIKQQLIRAIGKKDEAALLMNTALETIDNYPTEWIHIYSDGSATEGTTNAGYGSLIQFPDGTSKELHDSCGKFSTNYEAEAVAINRSIHLVSSIFEHSPEKKTKLVN